MGASVEGRRSQALGFVVATAGYLAATTGESLLAPVIPVVRDELGIDLPTVGLALGLLSAAIAVGNLGGGLLLARRGARHGVLAGLVVTAAGGVAAAVSQGRTEFLLAQVLIGLGSGTFFASGLHAVGVLGGTRRRGFAMGLFGVAFSGGLALAGVLAALAGTWGWRTSFLVVSGLAAAVAVASAFAPLPGVATRSAPPGSGAAGAGGAAAAPGGAAGSAGWRRALRRLLGPALLVGAVASATQYGTVSFFPSFAVAVWGLSPAGAALALTVARVLSVPAKLVSGNASDQAGTRRIAGRLGLALAALGLWWTLVPGPGAALWAAVVFAAFVSGLGPVANVLAFEAFGHEGALLGAFRSAQIALGAATTATIGALSVHLGLRTTLLLAALLPLILVLLTLRHPPRR